MIGSGYATLTVLRPIPRTRAAGPILDDGERAADAPRRGLSSEAAFPKCVFAVNLPIPKFEEIDASRLDPRAVRPSGEHRPFRESSITGGDMAGVLEANFRHHFEDLLDSLAHRGLSFVPASPRIWSSGRFEDAIRRHHAHESLKIVAAPGRHMRNQQIVID